MSEKGNIGLRPVGPLLSIPQQQMAMLPPEVQQAFLQMARAMLGMAQTLRATNERITGMEREIRLLTKVTPAQAAEINAAIRDRAAELCADYRVSGHEKAVANAIRRAVKLTTGTGSMRDLPRCEYAVALQQAHLWDDYKVMKSIRSKGMGKREGRP